MGADPAGEKIGPLRPRRGHFERFIKNETGHQGEDEEKDGQRLVGWPVQALDADDVAAHEEIEDGQDDQPGKKVGRKEQHRVERAMAEEAEPGKEAFGDVVEGDAQEDQEAPEDDGVKKTGDRPLREYRDLQKHPG
jgi:hypothetical protein